MNKVLKNKSLKETKKILMEHKALVSQYIFAAVENLLQIALLHDLDKFDREELDLFAKYSPKLRTCEYGSSEYFQYLKELKPALERHYKINRHHPEHFPEGIAGMNLIDLLEMIVDWLASTKRQKNGDIFKSIEKNQKRFGYGDELKQIFENTAKFLIQISKKETKNG